MTMRCAPPEKPLPTPRTRGNPRDNEPRFEVRALLHHLSGADLTQIVGIRPYSALRILAEIGTDMSRWPSERHFTSWLTLYVDQGAAAYEQQRRDATVRRLRQRAQALGFGLV